MTYSAYTLRRCKNCLLLLALVPTMMALPLFRAPASAASSSYVEVVPFVNVTVTGTIPKAGGAVTFSADATGGEGDYSYSWYTPGNSLPAEGVSCSDYVSEEITCNFPKTWGGWICLEVTSLGTQIVAGDYLNETSLSCGSSGGSFVSVWADSNVTLGILPFTAEFNSTLSIPYSQVFYTWTFGEGSGYAVSGATLGGQDVTYNFIQGSQAEQNGPFGIDGITIWACIPTSPYDVVPPPICGGAQGIEPIAYTSTRVFQQNIRCSNSNYLCGIDVARVDGSINWYNAIHQAGMTFSYIKALDGVNDAQNPSYFGDNVVAAKKAGLQVGAYHFARPLVPKQLGGTCVDGRDAKTQAIDFYNVIKPFKDYLSPQTPPSLDLEDDPKGYPSNCGTQTPDNSDNIWHYLSVWALNWLGNFSKVSGLNPIVYMNAEYAQHLFQYNCDGNRCLARDYGLWIAYYSTTAQSPSQKIPPGSWPAWMFWQYQENVRLPNIGKVDLDYAPEASPLSYAFDLLSALYAVLPFQFIMEAAAFGVAITSILAILNKLLHPTRPK